MIFDIVSTSRSSLGSQIKDLMSVADLPGDHSKERESAAEILDSLICSWRYMVCGLTRKAKQELRVFLVNLIEEYPLRGDSQEKFRTIHKHVNMLIQALGIR